VFGATAFSTYGGFWMSLGIFVVLANTTSFAGSLEGHDVTNALAWFLFSFLIFNTYMLLGSLRVTTAVFLVFLTLEITELVDAIAFWNGQAGWMHWGGWIGIVTAALAWYASAAGVMNGVAERIVLPVGPAIMRPQPATPVPA
jgi:succinate-acetate transporter protein